VLKRDQTRLEITGTSTLFSQGSPQHADQVTISVSTDLAVFILTYQPGGVLSEVIDHRTDVLMLVTALGVITPSPSRCRDVVDEYARVIVCT
jgi:hypothetical protein